MVSTAQFQKTRLRARSSLYSAKRQCLQAVIDIREVEHEVLHPKRSALADGRQLSRLQVRVREGRFGSPPASKSGERTDHGHDSGAQQLKTASHEYEIGVVGDKGAGCTQVDERTCRWRCCTKSVYMRHHIVSEAAFECGYLSEVDIVQVRSHLPKGVIGNGDARPDLALRFGQREPQAPPETVTRTRRP